MNNSDKQIDLKRLINIFYQSKFLIIIFTTIGILLSLGIALYLKNIYYSNALLQINEDQNQSSSGLGQYSDLAGLAGINLPTNSEDSGIFAVEVIRSRDFFYYLMEKHDLKLPIMASNGFDRETGNIIINKRIYDEKNKKWVRRVSLPLKPEPSAIETHEKFLEKNLSVYRNLKTGYIEIALSHHSPVFAKETLDLIIYELNETVRKRELNEAKEAVEFLKKQLSEYSTAESKNVIFKLMEKQINTQMMAERSDYLVKVIDSPNLPIKKSWPSRIMILIFGAILGLSFGMLITISRFYFKNDKETST